jgi:hypothetical protein
MGIEQPIETLSEGSKKSQNEKISTYARLYVESSEPIEHIYSIVEDRYTYDYESCIDELIEIYLDLLTIETCFINMGESTRTQPLFGKFFFHRLWYSG